jgi:hypothetical protein
VLLERIHGADQPQTVMNYEEAIRRAEMAAVFVQEPYWIILSKMLSRTIQSETEQLLLSDERKDMNRASIAICRKVLQAPYTDIEQGELADKAYQKAKEHYSRNRRGAENAPREV